MNSKAIQIIKPNWNSYSFLYPLSREAKVINTTDPEKLGRIQLKVYPELSDIPDADCPWCLPHTGGVHGKSFGVPLVGQLISCVVWNRYWNEITFLPFNITKPTEHLYKKWMENQRPVVTDIESDPEEEHLAVEQFEDDFTKFQDTKNSQHGFLHPKKTFALINKLGDIFIQSIKKLTFHNLDNSVWKTVDSENGDIELRTKGNVKETVDKNVDYLTKQDHSEVINGNMTEKVDGDRTEIIGGDYNIIVNGNYNLIVTGNVTINGARIDLN